MPPKYAPILSNSVDMKTKRSQELLEREQAIKELYQFIAEQVIAGLFKNDIIDKVIELGYDKYTAADLVDEMEERMQRIRKKDILIIMPPTKRRDRIRDAFTYAGFETQYIKDGQDFLKSIKRIVPDLVVMEHRPPHINAQELLALMRRNPIGRNIPVVVIASRRQMRDSFEAFGRVDFFLRSFDIDAMLQTIKKRFIIK